MTYKEKRDIRAKPILKIVELNFPYQISFPLIVILSLQDGIRRKIRTCLRNIGTQFPCLKFNFLEVHISAPHYQIDYHQRALYGATCVLLFLSSFFVYCTMC